MQLEAVVRRIRRLTDKDASAKVSHALQTNGLHFAYAKGRNAFDQAIARFKQPAASADNAHQRNAAGPNLQILLLLIKQGANGLNLTGIACNLCLQVNTSRTKLSKLCTCSINLMLVSVLHETHCT